MILACLKQKAGQRESEHKKYSKAQQLLKLKQKQKDLLINYGLLFWSRL